LYPKPVTYDIGYLVVSLEYGNEKWFNGVLGDVGYLLRVKHDREITSNETTR